jgi:hypothetical protein
MPPIRGINKTSLWDTWKLIRKELRNASIRDVIDYLDFDIDPDKWILRTLTQISEGRYEPSTPYRFTLGKSNGFSRTMTLPAIPDLVLYRTIVDKIYARALRREHEHVYFKREQLQQVQSTAQQSAAQALVWASQYRMTSQRSFFNWLRFAQYRKHLLLRTVHPYFVVTDITNFFDSVLHSHLDEALRGLAVPPRMLGLLFFLLERLAIKLDYAGSHAISLPVDESDCSRTLAHLLLFAHDDSMVEIVGEDNYVRWMDDQNFGVASVADGLHVLSAVGKSLARIHLSANAKKSRILSLTAARRHFHLDINELLDRAEATQKMATTRRQRLNVSAQIRNIWRRAQPHDGIGEFDKVLRRLYRLAGNARLRLLRRRATGDLLSNPSLSDRISDYMRCSGTVDEYLDWAENVIGNPEQIYPDVDVQVIESLLRIEADADQSRRIRRIAIALLKGKMKIPGTRDCRAIAPLLILRFGDRRSLPLLMRCFGEERPTPEPHVLRSAAIVYSSYGTSDLSHVRKAASRLLRNHLADVVRLVEKIRGYTDVPQRYKARVDLRYDSVARTKYVDMRALLTVRLLQLSRAPKVRNWVGAWKQRALAERISTYDRSLIKRLI